MILQLDELYCYIAGLCVRVWSAREACNRQMYECKKDIGAKQIDLTDLRSKQVWQSSKDL